jgi:penicillin-binding protein 2
VNSDQSRYKIIQFVFLAGAIILTIRAAQLQVFDTSYQSKVKQAVLRKIELLPARGLIYDRNKELLVFNEPVYELEVVYNELSVNMDTTLFCELLGITKEKFIDQIDKDWRNIRYSKSVPYLFQSRISQPIFSRFEEHLYDFPGFYPKVRNVRTSAHNSAAHLLGYISEVNRKTIEDSLDIYSPGDYIGNNGIEGNYEADLRGAKGVKYVLRDKLGKIVSNYNAGLMDSSARAGFDITSSIDLALQEYGELLMHNKRGAIVAIEPSTGEILSMVSAPFYSPNDLSIKANRTKAFRRLLNDSINKPLINRAILARYPPGSIFKPIMSLIALQLGVTYPSRTIYCPGAYVYKTKYNTFYYGCHEHSTPYNISIGLQYSCNSYFFQLARDVIEKYGFSNPGRGLDTLVNYLYDFGLGDRLGIGLSNENVGFIPDSEYYNWLYRSQNANWRSTYIMSIGIGQGEVELTTVQMANLAAIIANRGYFYTPHLIREFYPSKALDPKFTTKHTVRIDPIHFDPVIDGMERVISKGTATSAYIPGISICGKTGTSQNAHGENHSVFFAFAPKENPKIAIAVYVENAGSGGDIAAPIASLLVEKYLNKEINPNRQWLETRMLKMDLIGKDSIE